MRKWVIIVASVYAVGCGDSAPLAPVNDGSPSVANFILLTEYDGYLADVQSTIPNVNIMIGEFSAIVADFNSGFVPLYWVGEYTKNLIKRVVEMQARGQQIRPQHPELLKLHLEEYEAALEDFRTGFSIFVQAIEQPGSVATEGINDSIVAGNVHLIRLQILLGDLGGRPVDFFAQGGGGGGGNENLDDEFGF
jgi:soluble cytochrome b562